MLLWRGEYHGRLPRINRRHGARVIGGKGRVYVTPEYRKSVSDMARAFTGSIDETIDRAVDAYIKVSLWSRIDSDAPIKGILDALEQAQIVTNDKLVRDIHISREYHPRDDEDWVEITLGEAP